MTLKRTAIVAALTLTLAATVSAAVALAAQRGQAPFSEARQATARFHDVDKAVAAGYAEFHDAADIACIDLPGTGGMGVHFVNGNLVGDDALDPRTPEALVYERRGGKLHLVALEYIVFESAWQGIRPPALFGQTFDYVAAGNRYGLPPFYALHAWLWKPNPAGHLEAWNPRVSCE